MANLRVQQAADRIGVSKSTLDKMRCYGGGPAFLKIGRTVVYAESDIEAWLSDRPRTSTWAAANDNTFNRRAA